MPNPTDNHIDFNDPVARRIAWTGLSRKGNMFRSFKLVRTGPDRVEFRATTSTMFWNVVCVLIGLWLIQSWYRYSWMPILLGLCFVGLGIKRLVSDWKPLVLDKASGYIYKGRPQQDPPQKAIRAKMAEVHALQLITVQAVVHVSGQLDYHNRYELNLVLNSGERVNVAFHGSKDWISADARTLAEFLEVPLWDATSQ